jgi:hypothetical protein
MSNLSYIVSGSGRIAAVANGQPYTVDSDHPNYKAIKETLKSKDADQFIKLVDIPKVITAWANTRQTPSDAKVRVENGVIYYGDREIHNTLTKRILWMIEEGFDVTSFLLFLENLMQNPSRRAVQELYSWMEHQDVPITEDGCWIGYKYLYSADHASGKGTQPLPNEPKDKQILVDVHSRTVRQWIGKVVEMPRNEVDENWGVACSEGLHVGSSRYQFSGNVRVLVKVNPRDVVAVPGTETEKCRVCRYEIVKAFENVFNTPVVSAKGEEIKKPFNYLEDNDLDGDVDDDDVCDLCGQTDCDGYYCDEDDDD